MSRPEFVALIAMMFATIAFSIDAMLPALPAIVDELSPDAPHRAPLILTAFVFGMGVGTLFAGPLSDAFGRRNVIFAGAGLYIVSSAVAWAAGSIEVMLLARVFQGLGASGPRVVAVAVVRDLYSGREMARIVSFVMMVFTLVPAVAPLMGTAIIHLSDWRGIFAAFVIFSTITVVWMALRLPETLPPPARRPLRVNLMVAAIRETFSHPTVRVSMMVQTLAMAMLFATLTMVQQIYEQTYDRADTFAWWFGGVAVVAGTASVLNALLVVRFGMWRIVTLTLAGQIVLSGAMLVFGLPALAEPWGFAAFVVWQTAVFFQTGLTLGNLNAISMEPLGHIAGMAASVIGSVSTIGAALIASPLILFFDGTAGPLVTAILCMAGIGLLLMLRMRRIEAATAA